MAHHRIAITSSPHLRTITFTIKIASQSLMLNVMELRWGFGVVIPPTSLYSLSHHLRTISFASQSWCCYDDARRSYRQEGITSWPIFHHHIIMNESCSNFQFIIDVIMKDGRRLSNAISFWQSFIMRDVPSLNNELMSKWDGITVSSRPSSFFLDTIKDGEKGGWWKGDWCISSSFIQLTSFARRRYSFIFGSNNNIVVKWFRRPALSPSSFKVLFTFRTVFSTHKEYLLLKIIKVDELRGGVSPSSIHHQ